MLRMHRETGEYRGDSRGLRFQAGHPARVGGRRGRLPSRPVSYPERSFYRLRWYEKEKEKEERKREKYFFEA